MPNIFLLYGNDEFAIARKLKEFESDFPDLTTADMNTARLEARTMTENDLNNAINAAPFLAIKRLVLIASPSAKYSKPDSRKKFLEFLEKTPDTAKVVLYDVIEKAKDAEKHWLVKWAEKVKPLARAQGFFLPQQRDMPGWIINEAKNQKGQIEPAAAARLAEIVGVDPRQAGMEIAKLLAYVNWERAVRGSDVEAVCVGNAQQSVFDFVDALSQGNGKSAQKLLHRLLEDEDPFSLWGMVVRQFRLLLQAREILDRRGNKDDVARALSVHPFVAEKTSVQARRFSLEALEAIYRRLLEVDEQAKSGQLALDLALDFLIIELAY